MSYENTNTNVMTKDDEIALLLLKIQKLEEENIELKNTKTEEKEEETKTEETKTEEKEEDVKLTERNIIQYEGVDRIVLERKIQNCKNDILNNHDEKISIIHDNQEECSLSIVSRLSNRKIINVMVVAMTQSGKTGTMGALIKNYLKHNLIPIENIYIITGLSSIEWIEQTKERMPDAINNRIFHCRDLKRRFIEDVKNKKNVLIIIDEIQVAAKEGQSLHKSFREAGYYNKQNLFKNDIKIVEFSATPDGTIYDLMKWNENAYKLQMQPGNGYTSCFDLLDTGRVKQCKDLCCYNIKTGIMDEVKLAENMLEIIEDINSFERPMYHLIRTPTGVGSNQVIANFKKYYDNDLEYIKYDQNSQIKDINTKLIKEPEKHTFIFIKEKLRCAKTLEQKFIGITYERFTKRISERISDDAVTIQGLLGRLTGYINNGISICYTNIPSIEKYRILWDSNFEDKSVKWISKTTKMNQGTLVSKGTYNAIHSDDDTSSESSEEHEPVIKKFTHFDEVKKYVKEDLGNKRGPNNPKKYINSDGFYECNVRSVKKVWDINEMYIERKCNIKNGAGYGFRYCYEDINDKSTLQFWIIHY